MPQFAAGAVACAAVPGHALAAVRRAGRMRASAARSARALTYVPILFMALVALLWGTRGATLAAFLGALIAIVNTAQRRRAVRRLGRLPRRTRTRGAGLRAGDRADRPADRGARRRATQRHARGARVADALRGGDRRASACSRTNGIPRAAASSSPGIPRSSSACPRRSSPRSPTGWRWSRADDRERVATRFDERVRGQGAPDTTTYLVRGPRGAPLDRHRRSARDPRPRRRSCIASSASCASRRRRATRRRRMTRQQCADAEPSAPPTAKPPASPANVARRRVPHPWPGRHAVRPGLDAQAPEERGLRHALADAARARHEAGGPGRRHRGRLDRRGHRRSTARSATSIRGCT